MQTIKVGAVTQQSRKHEGKTFWGVKHGEQWYNLFVEAKPARGATFNVDVTERIVGDRKYLDAVLAQATTSNGNGAAAAHPKRMKWEDYTSFVRAAHALANELEPDIIEPVKDAPPHVVADRSSSRHAIVATLLISFGRGDFEYEEYIPE